MWRFLALTTILLFPAEPALAYIGPGAGAGLIATVIGILTAILLALFAVLWYPIKRFFKPKHGKNMKR
jgi:hypothetical protein